MNKFLKGIFITLILCFGVLGVLSFDSANATTAFTKATDAVGTSAGKAGLNATANPTSVVSKIVNFVVGVLGVVSVILVLYAGGLWLTAAGSDDKVTKAKKILRSVVVGVIIVGLAFAITNFIIGLAL